MKAKVDAIAAHGINCFVNRQLIYNYPESLLADKGIVTIEHADFEGVERDNEFFAYHLIPSHELDWECSRQTHLSHPDLLEQHIHM